VIDAANTVPANKIVLALPAFGHDWQLGEKRKVLKVSDVTYHASNSKCKK
jgi:spore germination protein YaaH